MPCALRPYLTEETGLGAGSFLSINQPGIGAAAALLGLKAAPAMACLLRQNIWPRRFSRNRGVLTATEQARLLEARAAIIGCGGLGGYVAALLARVGLGALTLCDGDAFEESNLNRQLFCRESRLGRNKAEVTAEEIFSIASHVEVTVCPEAATAVNAAQILRGADIVVDCLDSIPARLAVEKAAHSLGLPFVHGSIAGEEGFAMITRPGERGLAAVYGGPPPSEAAEKRLGVPTVTPAALACLQAHLAVRELTGREPKAEALYHLDLSVPGLEALFI
ncbi:MAG: HesA/MoeB/ThiF family protein [Candidatus Adiutrix sp.]|jgi:molybdopterin/thiamine biosynthesis adenylyltransferase|nr:HesA/MoeB/ThiF family protein [Candidatus Adiutrix sp.]